MTVEIYVEPMIGLLQAAQRISGLFGDTARPGGRLVAHSERQHVGKTLAAGRSTAGYRFPGALVVTDEDG
ncbi:MAG TPA: hypothetical protein VJT72_09030 [Pseudonocardiaceae bacterium]|nr:hypothetical protein [Pseudonocardiaceae bacterium]